MLVRNVGGEAGGRGGVARASRGAQRWDVVNTRQGTHILPQSRPGRQQACSCHDGHLAPAQPQFGSGMDYPNSLPPTPPTTHPPSHPPRSAPCGATALLPASPPRLPPAPPPRASPGPTLGSSRDGSAPSKRSGSLARDSSCRTCCVCAGVCARVRVYRDRVHRERAPCTGC